MEVALEATSVITQQKDGKLKKTYMGLADGRSKVMGEMKKGHPGPDCPSVEGEESIDPSLMCSMSCRKQQHSI